MSMQIDTNVPQLSSETAESAALAEECGFDRVWTEENDRDGMLPLPLVADRTTDIELGPRVTIAFVQSPMKLAYMAWDLARFSDGRFVLGIGTQVKGHITRRFSGDWESPGPRLREVVESLQAIFDVFQGRTDSLEYEGEFYSFSLMPEFFRPDPIEHPDIPIHLAAFNPYNLSVVGELCDGLALHPLNTPEYTTEVTSKYVRRGADKADRSTDDIWYSAEPIVATGRSPSERERSREAARRRVSFYASSRTFHDVLEFHGFGDIGERLHELSTEGRWSEMPELVTEEMYETFVLDAPADDLVDATTDRWEGIADSAILPFEYRSAYDLPR